MMPIEPVTLSFSAAILLGLSFGAGPCNIACLPYLGPVFMATDQGMRNSWRILLPFSLGRMFGYALLGTAAGWAGLLVQDWIDEPWVRWVLGGATILLALSILWQQKRNKPVSCHTKSSTANNEATLSVTGKNTPLMPGALFGMGAGMALNPCAPLTTIILAAATTASAVAGMSLGLGFALGAIIVPTLMFATGIAHFGTQVRLHLKHWRGALEKTSVALLLLLGFGTAMGWIVP
jgi:cytochrome c biogenesis protein CcdA